jgi:Trypsin
VFLAAHSFVTKQGRALDLKLALAVLGSQDLSNLQVQEDTVISSLTTIIFTNPSYTETVKRCDSDLAIVELADSIAFTDKIFPINLPKYHTDKVEGKGIVVGWSGEIHDGILTGRIGKLGSVQLETKESLKCLREHNSIQRISSRNQTFCVGEKDPKKKGPCFPDSGFFLQDPETGKLTLEGIFSCIPDQKTITSICDINKTSIFTKVTFHLEWIEEEVTGGSDSKLLVHQTKRSVVEQD